MLQVMLNKIISLILKRHSKMYIGNDDLHNGGFLIVFDRVKQLK